MCIWALCFSLLQIEHFETCFTDGKRKKNLNIEKPKTLKTSQNDKLFLKKKKKKKKTIDSARSRDGLTRPWS